MKKKLLAVLLVATMVLSLVACGKKEGENQGSEGGSGSTSKEGSKYTFHDTNSTVNTFSPTDWQLNSESAIISPCSSALYDFFIDKDAAQEYAILPEMATAMPEDVTAEYAGTYGIPADATEGYAWKCTLRQDLKWDDGTAITTHDYEYSLQQYLNPDMKNYRSNSYTDGTGAIYNAKGYYTGTFGNAADRGKTIADMVKDGDGWKIDGQDVYFGWGIECAWCSGKSLKAYADYLDPATVEKFDSLADGQGKILLTQEVYDLLFAFTSSDDWGNESEDDLINYFFYDDPTSVVTWDQVGFKAIDDYTMVFITCNQLTEFYFIYNVASLTLVKEDLYEANKKEVGGLIKSSYGTSVETFASYGPYKLDSYQEGKAIHMTKNENWFGYTDGNHEGMYQTTDIDLQIIDDHTTVLNLFLQGKLDGVTLTADDIPDYGTSEYTIYSPDTYTATYAWNTDFDTLKSREDKANNENKTIFTYIEWRKAFSLAMDRNDFCKTCTSGYEPAYGIVNNLYTYDPDTMASYRASEPAKQTLCEVYGADDVSKLSGYDVDAARELLQQAYDKCYADGNIDDDDTVVVEYHIYGTETIYQRMVDFCQNAMSKAAEGTSLEGRIKFVLVEDKDYYNSAKRGECDLIRENWGGAAMNPFGMLECYCTSTSNEYGFDYNNYTATITVNGETKTQSVNKWYDELVNGQYSAAEPEIRLTIMAGVEKALLLNYHICPVAAYTSASMISQRIELPTDHYINQLLGWGTYYRDYHYSMDDAEWEKYCKDQNNELTYK